MYYSTDRKGEDNLKGRISLVGANVMSDVTHAKGRDFVMLLRGSDMDEFLLSAFTKSKMEEWKTAILSAIIFALQQTIRYLPAVDDASQTTNPLAGGVVYKSGWLIKRKTKGLKGYELRFFILSEKALHYFVPGPEREFPVVYKRSIQLKTCRIQSEDVKDKYYLMRLTDTSQDSEVIMGTQDPRNFEQWRNVITSVIENAQKYSF